MIKGFTMNTAVDYDPKDKLSTDFFKTVQMYEQGNIQNKGCVK